MCAATPRQILLVDDDSAILEAVSDLLQVHDFQVVTAADGQAGLACLQGFQPEMIISDIAMPIMDGFQFFNAVRQNPDWAAIPFIFLTARGQQADISYGYTLGIDDYITKPFEPLDLIVKVEARLKRVREIRSIVETESDRIKQQLITVFSHEIRTPLTYIYGYASLLRDDRNNLDDETIDQMLNGVHVGAERLVRLVEDLLFVIRIDNGVLAMEVERRTAPTDLNAICQRALATLQPFAATRGVMMEADIPPGLKVNGLSIYLENALTRLIDNGIRYSKPTGGRIAISASANEHDTVVRIVDDGIGIDAADHQRVFERFTQVDRKLREQQGLGLGLAVAKSVIEAHHGTITLESEPDGGATFEIRLPLA